MAHSSRRRRRCASFAVCRAGENAARRGRAYFGQRSARSGTVGNGGVAPADRERLAHVLAQSRRLGIADDARLEVAAGLSCRCDRVARAQGAARRTACELWLRRRGASSRQTRCARRSQTRQHRGLGGTRRLARVHGNVHPRRRRSQARNAGCRTGGIRRAMGSGDRGRTCRVTGAVA